MDKLITYSELSEQIEKINSQLENLDIDFDEKIRRLDILNLESQLKKEKDKVMDEILESEALIKIIPILNVALKHIEPHIAKDYNYYVNYLETTLIKLHKIKRKLEILNNEYEIKKGKKVKTQAEVMREWRKNKNKRKPLESKIIDLSEVKNYKD